MLTDAITDTPSRSIKSSVFSLFDCLICRMFRTLLYVCVGKGAFLTGGDLHGSLHHRGSLQSRFEGLLRNRTSRAKG